MEPAAAPTACPRQEGPTVDRRCLMSPWSAADGVIRGWVKADLWEPLHNMLLGRLRQARGGRQRLSTAAPALKRAADLRLFCQAALPGPRLGMLHPTFRIQLLSGTDVTHAQPRGHIPTEVSFAAGSL
jgi:hypothetical protein